MKVLVCGGRSFFDYEALDKALRKLDCEQAIRCIITGGAPGADTLAMRWAAKNHRALMVFHAHWAELQKRAGPIRNGWMLEYGQPDILVALPGGTGTNDMIARAEKAGVRVWRPLNNVELEAK